VKGLNLAKFGNSAGVRQIVISLDRTLVFEGRVFGGAADQVLILDKGAFTFGLGLTF
jgi:hypothetical protein